MKTEQKYKSSLIFKNRADSSEKFLVLQQLKHSQLSSLPLFTLHPVTSGLQAPLSCPKAFAVLLIEMMKLSGGRKSRAGRESHGAGACAQLPSSYGGTCTPSLAAGAQLKVRALLEAHPSKAVCTLLSQVLFCVLQLHWMLA